MAETLEQRVVLAVVVMLVAAPLLVVLELEVKGMRVAGKAQDNLPVVVVAARERQEQAL